MWYVTNDWAHETADGIRISADCLQGHLQRDLVEQFMWNVQYALAKIVWQDYLLLEEKTELIGAIPALIAVACGLAGKSGAIFQFWDSVQEMHGFYGDDTQVMDLIYRTLEVQVQFTDSCCQMSALHGLNHLHDERARALLVRMAGAWANSEVEAYAQEALRFASA